MAKTIIKQTEFMTFKLASLSETGKTKRITVHNKKSDGCLGFIYWYPPFRKYVFQPNPQSAIVFDSKCLNDIKEFLEELMKEHKS